MCILIVKPKDKLVPSKEILEECFDRNPDGAGFSYNKNGVIVLRKGFMTFDDFYEATKKIPTESTALIHCRIGTSGGNTQGLTHPYPLCNDYKKMQKINQIIKPEKNKKAYAVAHNGIFSELEIRKDVNDTCVFVANILNPLNEVADDILDDKLDAVINRCTDTSKIAILDNEGNCKRYGSGWIEDSGIYYSNSTYKPYVSYYNSHYDWRDYDYYDDYSYNDVIYDKDCYYMFNKRTNDYDRKEYKDDYGRKEYSAEFIARKIKQYGSWDNYLNYLNSLKDFTDEIDEKESKEIEDLKALYPNWADDIDYYISQGLTAFQLRQWITSEYFDEEDFLLDRPEEDDYYEDETGLYRMEIKDGKDEIILKKVDENKDNK